MQEKTQPLHPQSILIRNQNIVKHCLHVCSAGDHEQREVTRNWCRVSGPGRRGIYPVSHKLSRHCHAVSRYVTLVTTVCWGERFLNTYNFTRKGKKVIVYALSDV